MTSGFIASRLRAVSRRVSPLVVDGVGRQALGRDLEARARARRGLEEEVDDGAPAQRRHLLDGPGVDLEEGLGQVDDLQDLVG
jgi:hypothetical protein